MEYVHQRRQRSRRSLNDFPDEVLCHIISFLPTKLAFRTSVLSKKWRYLWKSIPDLDFYERYKSKDDYSDRDYKTKLDKFMDFVTRALCFDNAPSINRFSLNGEVEEDSRIHEWISAAVSRNVKQLYFYFSEVELEKVFPDCLFTCQTLQYLEIDGFVEFLLPSQICLPNLKVLKLRNVTYKNFDELKVLFASPALEELVLDNCVCEEGDEHRHLCISAPKLRSLTIEETGFNYSAAVALATVTISSPLTTFYYNGTLAKDYRLSCSSFLVVATLMLDMYSLTSAQINVDHFYKVLRSFRFVKHLKLSTDVVKGLSHSMLPVFTNLVSLEFLKCSVDLGCKDLKMLLNQCPRLETLKIPKGISKNGNINRMLSPMFTCLSSLKHITIGSIKGNIEDLVAVHILLAKATSLETIEISVSYNLDVKIKTFFSGVPLGSKYCKLNFIVNSTSEEEEEEEEAEVNIIVFQFSYEFE